MAKATLKIKENCYRFMRKLGYIPQEENDKTKEISFIRKIKGSDYPRFHIYLKKEDCKEKGKQKIKINLHLDQKRPIFDKSSSHAAEYKGKVVEEEIGRIKNKSISSD